MGAVVLGTTAGGRAALVVFGAATLVLGVDDLPGFVVDGGLPVDALVLGPLLAGAVTTASSVFPKMVGPPTTAPRMTSRSRQPQPLRRSAIG